MLDRQDRPLECKVIDLGIIGFREAYKIQKGLVSDVINGSSSFLAFCEHPSVLTLGKLSHNSNVLLPEHDLSEKGIEIISIDRGGDVTLHSLGQLVVYPIFSLNDIKKDIRFYLNKLEQVAIDLLRGFDIVANRFPSKTGVWVDNKKIVSIGIGIKKWVTFHGMGINVNTDLDLFSFIRPCGLDVDMTSIRKINGKNTDMDLVKKEAVRCFSENFNIFFL